MTKKKTIFGILAIIMLVTYSNAQVILDLGETVDNDGALVKILGGNDSTILGLRYGKSRFYIEKYNTKTLKQEFLVECFDKKKQEKENCRFSDAYYTNGDVIVLYLKNWNSIFYKTIDGSGRMSDEKKLIDIGDSKFVDCQGCWLPESYSLSPDSKHLALAYVILDQNNIQHFVVFNTETMQKENDFSFPIKGQNSVNNIKITNGSSVLFINSEDKSMSMVGENIRTPKTVQLNFGKGNKIISLEYTINDSFIIAGGFFKGEESGKRGVFCETIDPNTMTVKSTDSNFFTDEVEMAFTESSKLTGFNPQRVDSLRSFNIDNIQTIGNNFYFVGQDYELVTKYSENSSFSTTFTITQNVIYFKVGEKSKIGWMSTLPFERIIRSSMSISSLTRLNANTSFFAQIPTAVIDNKLMIITGSEKMYSYTSIDIKSVACNLIDVNNKITNTNIGEDSKQRIYSNAHLLDVVGVPALLYCRNNTAFVYRNRKGDNKMGRISIK